MEARGELCRYLKARAPVIRLKFPDLTLRSQIPLTRCVFSDINVLATQPTLLEDIIRASLIWLGLSALHDC